MRYSSHSISKRRGGGSGTNAMAHFALPCATRTRVSLDRSPSETSHAALLGREFPSLISSCLSLCVSAAESYLRTPLVYSCRLKPQYFTTMHIMEGVPLPVPRAKKLHVFVQCVLLIARAAESCRHVTIVVATKREHDSLHQETPVRHTSPEWFLVSRLGSEPAAIGLSSGCKK